MLDTNDLSQFTGSLQWTEIQKSPTVLVSEGAIFVAEKADAYWLLQAIASYYISGTKVSDLCKTDESFKWLHFWKLTVDLETKTCVLSCRKDSTEPVIVTQEIPYTDFPLAKIEFYAGYGGGCFKIFLPSEY